MREANHVHELSTRVEAGDIDGLGHVNNLVYLRWVQEAAISHWRVLASAEEQARVAWVVHRHEIDYLRPAFVGEAITLRTWVGVATPATFERLTEIVRQPARGLGAEPRPSRGVSPQGTGDGLRPASETVGQVLARARTLWCPIDPATGRLRRIDEGLRARVSVVERVP